MTAAPIAARRRRAAILAAPAVLIVMYPLFFGVHRLLGNRMDGYLAWSVGLAVYWLLWGIAFPLWALGLPAIRKMLSPRPVDAITLALVALPSTVMAIGRVAGGAVPHERSGLWVLALLTVTAFGNGLFEELLWRRVYLHLFADQWRWQLVWPSFWFGLWHIAPVASRHGPVLAYVGGAMALGLCLAVIARRSAGVFWPIVAHTAAALVAIA